MPTGVRLADVRQQLFDAAGRVLLRDGPRALTSRAVTEEAGCAKGVLHRHFADFDDFLTELVMDRAAELQTRAVALQDSVGKGPVIDNVAAALTGIFGPVPLAIIPLIIFRDTLRERLQQIVPGGGTAILGQATRAVAAYLAAERDLGRLAADADIDSITLSLVGGGHLLITAGDPLRPDSKALRKLVSANLADAVRPGPVRP